MFKKYDRLISILHLTSIPKEYRKPNKRDHQDAKAIKYFNDTVRETSIITAYPLINEVKVQASDI